MEDDDMRLGSKMSLRLLSRSSTVQVWGVVVLSKVLRMMQQQKESVYGTMQLGARNSWCRNKLVWAWSARKRF